ncbi:MAG: tetratricopeptide repeat protein, partial [Nitrospiria bacterium]
MNNIFLLLFFFLTSCAAIHNPSVTSVTDKSLSQNTESEDESLISERKNSSLPDRIADPEAYYHFILGNIYELDNNIPRAYFEYKSALILDPKSTTLKYDIATLAVREGDLKSAEEYIQSLLEIEPNHVEGLGLLG